jgi:hypothetical protein
MTAPLSQDLRKPLVHAVEERSYKARGSGLASGAVEVTVRPVRRRNWCPRAGCGSFARRLSLVRWSRRWRSVTAMLH